MKWNEKQKILRLIFFLKKNPTPIFDVLIYSQCKVQMLSIVDEFFLANM